MIYPNKPGSLSAAQQVQAKTSPPRCRFCAGPLGENCYVQRDMQRLRERILQVEEERDNERGHNRFLHRTILALKERVLDLYEWYTPPPVRGLATTGRTHSDEEPSRAPTR